MHNLSTMIFMKRLSYDSLFCFGHHNYFVAEVCVSSPTLASQTNDLNR